MQESSRGFGGFEFRVQSLGRRFSRQTAGGWLSGVYFEKRPIA